MKVKKGARLIVEYEEEYEEDFQIAMLRKNKIPHLLKMEVDGIGRKTRFSYQAEGMTSMAVRFEKRSIKEADLREFLMQYEEVKEAVRDHMLMTEFLWLDPTYIYYRDGIYWFAYLPVLKTGEREQFHKFTNFLVRKIDYRDVECIQLAHQLNRESMEETFSLSDCLERYDRLETRENWVVREETPVFGSVKESVKDMSSREHAKKYAGEFHDGSDTKQQEWYERETYGEKPDGKEANTESNMEEEMMREGRFLDPFHKTWSRIRKRRWGRWQDLILESDGQEDESSL